MDASCELVMILFVMKTVQGSGLSPSLTGPSSGVLGSSVRLFCVLPRKTMVEDIRFLRSKRGCVVNTITCTQSSNLEGYSCGCVAGSEKQFYLHINSLSLQDERWTCSYYNIYSMISIERKLNVYYAPSISSSFPNKKDVTENSSINIDCSSGLTAGNPSDTSYTWTGPGGYSKSGSVLDRIVSRSQGGSYTCTARNSEGLSDSAQVNINVQCE